MVCPRWATLYQKDEILAILGAAFPPHAPIGVKCCSAKQTHASIGGTEFLVNRCNESPLRGENVDFFPVSKFNTCSLPLRGNPAGNNTTLPSIAAA